MLEKLLRLYRDTYWFEIGNGFACGTDLITFTIVRDPRFQGFPDGNIETEDLKRLAESDSFGYELGAIWVGDEKKSINIYPSSGFYRKISSKKFDKPFESNELAKAIRKIKITDTQSLVFEGYKDRINVRILDADENFLFYMNLPEDFDQRLLYDWKVPRLKYKWELVKRSIKLKNANQNPRFSIVKFGGGIFPLLLHWEDCDVYIANYT